MPHNASFVYKVKSKAKQSAKRLRKFFVNLGSFGLAIINKAKAAFAAAMDIHSAPVAVETSCCAHESAQDVADQLDVANAEEFSPVWSGEVSAAERATSRVADYTVSTSQVTLIDVAESPSVWSSGCSLPNEPGFQVKAAEALARQVALAEMEKLAAVWQDTSSLPKSSAAQAKCFKPPANQALLASIEELSAVWAN
ncbi:hypothetical protein EV183_002637 [Coemansia sp. RSA 2336]|nr:hypothetical protein EV183_002637 [Coemansia sp. RSA 2336]